MRTRAQTRVDRAGFYAYSGLQAVILYQTWGRMPLWQAAVAAVLGYVLADLFTGLLHWGFDTWGSAQTPGLGQIIAPFRQHHVRPDDIKSHEFLEAVGNSCWAIQPLLLTSLLLPPFWAQLLSWVACWSVQANLVHRASHRHLYWLASAPAVKVYRFLVQLGLVQDPEDHELHHRRPHKQNWCILVGWWNPPLNWLLPRIERGLTGTPDPE